MIDGLLYALGSATSLITLGVGYVAGRRSAYRAINKPPEPICGCEHSLAMHDRDSNQCHGTNHRPSKYSGGGATVAWADVPCTCRQYVGPQPIDQFFQPRLLPPAE